MDADLSHTQYCQSWWQPLKTVLMWPLGRGLWSVVAWKAGRDAAVCLSRGYGGSACMLRVRAHDPMSGYFAVRRSVFDRVPHFAAV